jgi:subtilase family serine protease
LRIQIPERPLPVQIRAARTATLLLVSLVALAASAGTASAASSRVCGLPFASTASCNARVVTDPQGAPAATAGPAGLSPAQLRGAYGLGTGTAATPGPIVAIIDAYDAPTIAADLATYATQFGLSACTTANGCFTKVNQKGLASPLPKANPGWALETSLDVETVHAICQTCRILLVEANSASFADLSVAVNQAAAMGARVISNSYGGGESQSFASDLAYSHPGVAVTVSTGDNGFGTEYPATSPYVVAVGGTKLTVAGSATAGYTRSAETAWTGAGSGCSSVFTAPAFQSGVATGCTGKRAVADVSAVADPASGAAIYDSTRYQGRQGWYVVGGTSLSAPLVGAIYGLANDTSSLALPVTKAYGATGSLFDVTSGSNGSCSGAVTCTAGTGYDGPTGLGTPNGLGAF